MFKKNPTIQVSFVSLSIFSAFVVSIAGIWLYAAHCFEKNVTKIHDTLTKTGYITTGDVHIQKYRLQASFEKPIIQVPIDDVYLSYIGGNRLNLSYHLLTKTITLQIDGDESIILDDKVEPIKLVTLLKKNNINKSRFSIRFAKFFPKIAAHTEDYASLLKHIVDTVKSVRLHFEDSDIGIKGIGTFSAKLIKYTTEPLIQKEKNDTVTLHFHDRYIIDGFSFIPDKDNEQPINSVPLPAATKAHSHMIISFGDKSQAATHKIINEFGVSKDWMKLLGTLTIENKNEGKQTFEGLSRTSNSNIIYTGSKGTIDGHIDINDTYDSNWKLEYLPLLKMLTTLWGGSTDQEKPVSDEKLLSLFPKIEKHNPVKKTADINVAIDKSHVNTKISLCYDIEKHGAQVTLEIPFRKTLFDNFLKKISIIYSQDLQTFIDGSITAKIILKKSDAILDDIESILVNYEKTFDHENMFGNITSNRKIAEMLLNSFGEKMENNQLKIQASYDTKLKKINYDTATNVGDIVTKMLPMLFSSGFGHDEHEHKHKTNENSVKDAVQTDNDNHKLTSEKTAYSIKEGAITPRETMTTTDVAKITTHSAETLVQSSDITTQSAEIATRSAGAITGSAGD